MSRLAVAASTRGVARLVAMPAFAAALFVAGTLGSSGTQAQERELAPTVIVACDHVGRPESATRMGGVETAGRVPGSLVTALQLGTPCAEVFNLLARGGFELIHRMAGAAGDFDGDADVDGRDFLVWQRGGSPAPARPSARVTTVLLSCRYVVADTLTTKVSGSEIAGPIDAALAAKLATRPSSCAEADAALAGAGFGLVSAAPTPTASAVDASDLAVWQSNFGSGP